jgi:hypothetical protein
MKRLTLNQYVSIIRLSAVLLVLAIVSLFLLSFTIEKKMADDIWKQLGISKTEGTNSIRESFLSDYLQYYQAKNFKNIVSGDREAVTKDLLEYTKQYINGPEFKKAYENYRVGLKPREPEYKKERTKEEVQKEEVAKLQKTIKDNEETIKTLTGDVKKGFEQAVVEQKKMLKDYQDPKNQMWEFMAQADVNENKYKREQFKRDMEKWEKDLPANPSILVKQRLEKFMKETADIDYNAELKDRYNKKVFVKPEYERKSREWKMGFRAGKNVTETARAFIQKWLSELK